jgi:parvulin-like peptidyl-prolyl isomerase
MKLLLSLLPVLLLSAVAVFAQQNPSSQLYLARAGDVYISEEEFLRRYELLPSFGRHRPSQLEQAKGELLYSMIAEKLLAQEAESRKMDREPSLRGSLDEVRKMLARDELYREEITGHAAPERGEILRGMSRARTELVTSFLFFQDEETARFVRGRIRKGGDFDRLGLDSSLHALRDTAVVMWGDADTAIERAAYSLSSGQVSPVIAAGQGFYILRLESQRQNPDVAAMQEDVLAERVRTTLRLRKEKAILDAFSGRVLKERKGFAVGKTMKDLTGILARILPAPGTDTIAVLSPELIDTARILGRSLLGEQLAVIDSESWTVSQVLDRIALKGLTVPLGSPRRLMAALNGQLRVWVLQELMAQEAIRRGLDTVAQIRDRLATWKAYFLAEAMKGKLKDSVSVSEAEVWTYLRRLDTTVSVPQVRIRELRTASVDAMQEAFADLEHGASLVSVIRARSNDPEARSREGAYGFFPITERYPVGETAWRMEPGERFGPVAVRGGYLYFELLEKKSGPRTLDSAAAARFAAATTEMLRLKQNRKVSLFLARLGEVKGVDVFEDRVKMISVTPVPMMTYRILGFGGRMFEVPFVERQIDWLSIESPSSQISP